MTINVQTFGDELRAAGLGEGLTWDAEAVYGWTGLSEADQLTLDEVIAAHDPTKPTTPLSATKLGLKRAMEEAGEWENVKALIAASPEIAEDWSLAIEIRRDDPMFSVFASFGDFTSDEIDAVFRRAVEITA